MFWIKFFSKLLQAIQDGDTPRQLAMGFVLGFMMGIIPGWPLIVWMILIPLILFSVNLGMAAVGAMVASALAWLLDPILHATGMAILKWEPLLGLFTYLYNNPFWMLTRFNNSVVMGGLAIGLVLSVPFYFLAKILIIQYRVRFMKAVEQWKIIKILKGSKIYGVIQRLQRAGVL